MDDLFTIISVVIAVSGATYAALVAIRDYFGHSVKELTETACARTESMRDATNATLKLRAIRLQAWLSRLERAWMWSYGVPIIVFGLISYIQAAHVIVAYWNESTTKPFSGWPVYKWVLLAMMLIDALCILATVAAYFLIRYVSNEIQENHDAEITGKARELRPSEPPASQP